MTRTIIVYSVTGNFSLKRSQISRLLKEKNPDNMQIARDIIDAIAIAKRSMLDQYRGCSREATESQLAIYFRFKENSASEAATDLIFTPPEALQLWQRFPSVISWTAPTILIR